MGLGIAIRVDGKADDLVGIAASVEVIERIGQPTSYRISYVLDIDSGDFPLLKEKKLGAGSVLSVLVPVGKKTVCLVKGPVCGQEIRMEQGGSGSSLVVIGSDPLIELDREDKAVIWSDVTDSDAASSILGKHKLTADVLTTKSGHAEAKHTLVQRESDLAFLRRLARRNGYQLWVSFDDQGLGTAHFKRLKLDGEAECELVMNSVDPKSNIVSLAISWDVERPTSAKAVELDLSDKSNITADVDKSPLTALGGTGLADIASGARALYVHAPVDDNGDLQARGESALIDASFFVKATGTTTLSALGGVMRAHTLVKLSGVGSRHSGLWYCSSVRHSIDMSEHTMEFELIRNGWKA